MLSNKFGITSRTQNRDYSIIIYGAGVGGRELYDKLVNFGNDVECFVDKNALHIKECCGKKVYSVNEAKCFGNKQNIIIILSMQNALIHDSIAFEIYSLGYNRILYFPTQGSNVFLRKMRESWIRIQSGELPSIDDIPLYMDEERGKQDHVIMELSLDMVFWADVDSVRYQHLQMLKRPLSMTEQTKFGAAVWEQYAGLRIDEVTPYKDLFDYLEGKNEWPYLYLSAARANVSKEEQEQFLIDREQMFKTFKNALLYDHDMFVLAPIRAEFSNGLLYVKDGMHRAVFLKRNGFQRIPLITTKEDYYSFFEEKNAKM